MWFFIIGIILSFIFAPKQENRAEGLDATNFPRVTETEPVPSIYGKVRLRGPNTLWSGDFSAIPIYSSPIMVIIAEAFRIVPLVGNAIADWILSKIPISGYNYYVGLDLGLCLGPNVTLHKVYADKQLYYNSTTTTGGSLFLADKFSGPFSFYNGSYNQSVDSYLASKTGGDAPGYNGICHMVIKRAYIGKSPQLPPFSFELSRYTNNLGLTNPELFIGEDLNPAEIIYSILTDPWNGMGNDVGDINIPTFLSAATTLALEQNGSSVIVTSASNGGDVIAQLMKQIDGIVYQDVATGKISLKLVRQDYVVGNLPLLDENNIISLQNFTRSSWVNTFNQVRIKYIRRDKQYEDGTSSIQDLAHIGAQGRMLSTDVTMETVYNSALAGRLAARELAQRNVPIFSTVFEVNRTAFGMKPGDAFRFSWEDFGIVNMIMRIKQIDIGKLQDNRMIIEAAQDEFSTSVDVFGAPELGGSGINFSTQNVTSPLVIELPRILSNFDITQRNLNAGVGEGFLLALGAAGNISQIGYKTIHSYDNFANTIYGLDENTEFAATANLLTAVNPAYYDITRIIPTLLINAVNFGTRVLSNATQSQIKNGKNLIFIEGELMAYETVTNNNNGTWSLGNVHRALLDTAPGDHTYGTQVYFLTDYKQFVAYKFNNSGPIQTRFRSATPIGVQSVDSNTLTTVYTSLSERFIKPLPPRNMTVEISAVPSGVTGYTLNVPTRASGYNVPPEASLVVRWKRRKYDVTDITLFSEGDQAPEAGVTYNFKWTLNSISTIVSSITGTSASLVLPPAATGTLTFELESVRSGYHSTTKEYYSIEVL